jgi:lysophospholipid acyltransferase (LPLAT)-like uncharacterized protein
LRAGLTIYWGHFYLPIPFRAKVKLCIGEPIPVTKWTGDGVVPNEQIEKLHETVNEIYFLIVCNVMYFY